METLEITSRALLVIGLLVLSPLVASATAIFNARHTSCPQLIQQDEFQISTNHVNRSDTRAWNLPCTLIPVPAEAFPILSSLQRIHDHSQYHVYLGDSSDAKN